MNLSYFIAKKVATSGKQSFSRLIIRIAIIAVALSVTVMIVATALIRGFTNQISSKIFGFWGHIHIMDTGVTHSLEAVPVDMDQTFYPTLDTIRKIKYLANPTFLGYPIEDKLVEKETYGGIKHIQVFANIPGIIKTSGLERIDLRGIDKENDSNPINQYIIEGEGLTIEANKSTDIIISKKSAKFYDLEVGKSVKIYFEGKNGKRKSEKFTIKGIYQSGGKEDNDFGVIDGRILHEMINREPKIKSKAKIEGIILKGIGKDYNWEYMDSYLKEGTRMTFGDTISKDIIISQQTSNRLLLEVGDPLVIHFIKEDQQIPKRLKVSGIYKTGLEEYDQKFAIVDIRLIQDLFDWAPNEVGGFEVFLDDIRDIDPLNEHIYMEEVPHDLFSQTIRNKFPSIFEWLGLQDINEVVILSLMLIVSIINMITALLILILERTNMIGTLKALGNSNWNIQKIFLYYAGYIVCVGLFFGNLIGLAICFLQKKYEFISLSEKDYYLSVAPIEIDWTAILLLNIGTLVITLLFLIIPSYLVTRISPVKAIRFK